MIGEHFHPLISGSNDGFPTPEIEWWVTSKYKFLGKYLDTVASEVASKYDELVYLDLFAGAGMNRLADNEIIYGSPLISMASRVNFSKYIFCEKDPELANALRVRVNKYFRGKNVSIFPDDVNKIAQSLELYLPQASQKNKVFSLCLLDPFTLDLSFKTIEILSGFGVNFLFFMEFPLNSKSDYNSLLANDSKLLNRYLGIENIESLGITFRNNDHFFRTITKHYSESLEALGYRATGSFERIDSMYIDTSMGYWAYFSKVRNTEKVWKKAKKDMIPQMELFA